METRPSVPRAILVGIQLPGVDDVAHAASIEELGRLVKTLGYEVVGTISQKRDELDGSTVLGKGRLKELTVITGGSGVVGSMAIPRKSKARERFEEANQKKPDDGQLEPDLDAVELAPEPVDIGDDLLDLEQHRPDDAQVARAVLADDRFVLDGFGAKRAIHRRYLARLRITAISASALRSSS